MLHIIKLVKITSILAHKKSIPSQQSFNKTNSFPYKKKVIKQKNYSKENDDKQK